VKTGASEAASKTADAARDATERVRHTAAQVAGQAREYGTKLVEDQKRRAGDGLQTFVDAIRGAADRLHRGNDHNLAAYADAAAEQIDRAASYLRERPINELAGDLRNASRRRPEWVVGGMFIAGLAMARFLKASSPNREYRTSGQFSGRGQTGAQPYGQPDTFRRDTTSGAAGGGTATGAGSGWSTPTAFPEQGPAIGTGAARPMTGASAGIGSSRVIPPTPAPPPALTGGHPDAGSSSTSAHGRTIVSVGGQDSVTSVNVDTGHTPASGGGSAGGALHDPSNPDQPNTRGTTGGGAAEVK
jgi:hypothetical protein